MAEAVERCLQSDRTADALIIALATSQELYNSTRAKYLEVSGEINGGSDGLANL